jgi:uncharacterized membrane protein
MSDEQIKPAKKWYQYWLLYLLILVVLLMIVGLWVMTIGGHLDTTQESAYGTAKAELQNAVNNYQNKNNGAPPTINGTVTINGSTYKIINICPLLTQNEDSLQTIIESLWCGNGSNDDNWDGGCAECKAYSSYIWAVDDEGNIYSTCVGEHCRSSGTNGFQGRWP